MKSLLLFFLLFQFLSLSRAAGLPTETYTNVEGPTVLPSPGLAWSLWGPLGIEIGSFPTNWDILGTPTQTGHINTFDLTQVIIPEIHEFYLVYEGQLYVENGGLISFRLGSDDGSRLLIDGTEVTTVLGVHPYQTNEGQIFLNPGYHTIRVEFFENLGFYHLTVEWKLLPPQIILSPPSLTAADFASGIPNIRVRLSQAPSANVTVSITNPSDGVLLSTCLLVFTPDNWDQNQVVVVIPVSNFNPSNSQFNIQFVGTCTDVRFNINANLPVGKGGSSNAKCISWGDPHFTTFDGAHHNFQGVGDFVLTRTLDGSVVVQTRQHVCGPAAPSVTCNNGIAVKYGDSVIVIFLSANGVPSLELRSPVDPGIRLDVSPSRYLFTLPDGTIVDVNIDYWSGPHVYYFSIYVTAATYMTNRVRGLCGDFDGSASDDFTDVQAFGNSWKTPDGQSIFNWPVNISSIPDPNPITPPSDVKYEGTPKTCNPNIPLPPGLPGGHDGSPTLPNLPIVPPPANPTTPPPFDNQPCTWSSVSFQHQAEQACQEALFNSTLAQTCNAALGGTAQAEDIYSSCLFDAQCSDSLDFVPNSASALLELCKTVQPAPDHGTCPNFCSGHGLCNGDTCSCYSGYTGVDCSVAVVPFSIFPVAISCFNAGGSLSFSGTFSSQPALTCVFSNGQSTVLEYLSGFTASCAIPSNITFGQYFTYDVVNATDSALLSGINAALCQENGATPSPTTAPPLPPPCTLYPCDSSFEFQGTSYSFSDFDVLSYTSFKVKTGDVQGRVLVGSSFHSGDGYSIGHEAENQQGYLPKPFSLIALGDVFWGNGAIFPVGASFFAGGSFGSNAIYGIPENRAGGNCSACTAQPCCDSVSNALSSHFTCAATQTRNFLNYGTTTNYTNHYNGIFIFCSHDSFNYQLDITASDISAATWWCLNGCSAEASWVINIHVNPGDTVTLQGDLFPARNGRVIYNFVHPATVTFGASIGHCLSTVLVQTDINANIFAPLSKVVQSGGLVRGYVVACNYSAIDAMQVNVPCDDSVLEILVWKGYLLSVNNKRQASLTAQSSSNVLPNDLLTLGAGTPSEEQVSVLSVQDNVFTISAPSNSHSQGIFSFQFQQGRTFDPPAIGGIVTNSTTQPSHSSSTLLACSPLLLVAFLSLFLV